MKSLETVKKIYNILKAIALAFAIVCFVGSGICLLGCVLTAIGNALYGEEIAEALVNTVGQFDFGTLNESVGLIGMTIVQKASIICFGGALLTAANGAMFIFCHRYCKHFEMDGTPFSYRGANELRTVGILVLAIPFGAQVIVTSIFSALGVPTVLAGGSVNVTLGVVLILLSFVFKYGADVLAASGMDKQPQQPGELPPPTDGNGPDLV